MARIRAMVARGGMVSMGRMMNGTGPSGKAKGRDPDQPVRGSMFDQTFRAMPLYNAGWNRRFNWETLT